MTNCDPNLQTERGYSALYMAAGNGHTKVIETLLVNWNAKPNIQDTSGQSALHRSALNGHKDALQQLLDHNPQLADLQDNYDFTPLHYAVLARQISCIKSLVQAGANINIEAAGQLTPFMLAIWNHSEDTLYYLIKNGVELGATDCFGMNCVDWAALKYFTNSALEKKWRRIKPTTPSQRDAVVSRNISKLAQHLLHSGSYLPSSVANASTLIGRCLLRAGNTADAILALQLSALISSSAAIRNGTSEPV